MHKAPETARSRYGQTHSFVHDAAERSASGVSVCTFVLVTSKASKLGVPSDRRSVGNRARALQNTFVLVTSKASKLGVPSDRRSVGNRARALQQRHLLVLGALCSDESIFMLRHHCEHHEIDD